MKNSKKYHQKKDSGHKKHDKNNSAKKFKKSNFKKSYSNYSVSKKYSSDQIIEGRIFLTSRATGFIKADSVSPEDIRIPDYDLNTALHNDTVKVLVIAKRKDSRPQGKVIGIIERYKTEFVGTIEIKDGEIFFIPDDQKFYKDLIIIPNKISKKVKNGEKVIIQMNPWTDPKKNPQGEITKILGKKGDHNVEMESIIYEKGFSPTFPQNVEDEAHKIKNGSKNDFDKEVQKRASRRNGPPSGWDFRKVTTFTIDPFDAKDFDDALSFRELPDGNYEIGIHIADVTHYVLEGSIIDKEAIKRGTSIYMVDRTIPMLPEVLSNDLCSLNPNEDKLAMSAIFVTDKEGNVLNRWFGETIIKSDKRFTYKNAQEILDNGKGEFFNELFKLNEIASKKNKLRIKNGSISFGSIEVKFDLDKDGFPTAIHQKESLETNDLIEDFMLLANKEVSEYIERLNKKTNKINPFVYRIHDVPKKDNIIELETFLKTIGYELKTKDGQINSQEINHFLDKIQGIDEENLIEKAILKSMAKAIYSTHNIGHYGLAFKYYTHFTSPIRRYPDMMVHRLMKKYLSGEMIPETDRNKYQKLCVSSSAQELVAVEAERDSDKYKYTEYMSARIGQEFEGVISGVTEWGVYVQETETKAEGLVSKKTLKGDEYSLDPKNYRIVGKDTGKTFTLGDRVKIKLIATDLDRKAIDFEIIE